MRPSDHSINSRICRSYAPVPAVDRMHEIFHYLLSNPSGRTVRQISEDLRIPRSSLYRLVAVLEHYRYLQMIDAQQVCVLGPAFIPLARSANERLDLVEMTRPYMKRLAEQVNETVKLSVVKTGVVEVVSRVETGQDFKISVNPGVLFPIHAGAASKALLAFLPEADRVALVDKPLSKYTESTITDYTKLRKILQEIRESCVSYDFEEHTEGIAAVGCPVFNFLQEAVGALSIPFIASKKNLAEQAVQHRATCLMETARIITTRLGGVYPV